MRPGLRGTRKIAFEMQRDWEALQNGASMLAGIGTDIHEVGRMERELRRGGALIASLFTPSEIGRCSRQSRPARAFASCFAVKEATLKALGTGWQGGVSWHDVEVAGSARGPVQVSLAGVAREVAARLGVRSIDASVSCGPRFAMAAVFLQA